MIEVNVAQTLMDLEGEPLTNSEGETVTLRDALINGLMNTEGNTPAKEQFERYQLAQRIHGRDIVEFSSEEVTELKEAVGKVYRPLVTGQVWTILEGLGEGSAD